MSFGENIQFLRKRENMTQEELAEKMNVSRQTVSKWESDTSYPETDKILQICDMFSCDMNTLMRGNAEGSVLSDTENYDRTQNNFAKAISGGCASILAGITIFLILFGLGLSEIICTMILMVFIVIAVTVFIISGINHDGYVKKHPQIKPFYKDDEIERFNHRFPYLIAIPIALIFLGIILVIGGNTIPMPSGFGEDRWNSLISAPLLLMITLAVATLVYAGMQKSKYDIDEYNKANAPDEETVKQDEKSGKWCGCIMLTATAVFLMMGFIGNLWHISWVVFPIGGILCGIVSTALKKSN